MKTVIDQMLVKAGAYFGGEGVIYADFDPKKFAELVRADEVEKYKWDIHSCGPTCTKVACVAMREAVEAEREACAKLCKFGRSSADIEQAIRARSNI